MNKTNLLGLNQSNLNHFFFELGEKSYRSKQLMQWVYHKDVIDFNEMSNLSANLRDKLDSIASFNLPLIKTQSMASDGVIKWVLSLDEDSHIEMVYIPENQRGTLCISSQVGCALDCSFCSTGKQGFNRNLSTAEIMSQLMIAKLHLNSTNQRITNVVFMGMGEPLLNEKSVYESCDLLLDDMAYGLSRRKVTISTSGVVPAIYRMCDSTNVSLAISLHASDNDLRDELVPINQKYPINELMEACHHFINSGSQERHVLFEYVMLDGVNDSETQAKALAKLLKNISAKVNLIPFNPFPNTQYKTSNRSTIEKFQDILYSSGIRTMTRRTRGDDVDAACGQLVGKVKDKSKRSLRDA